jgi:hypothetical protein
MAKQQRGNVQEEYEVPSKKTASKKNLPAVQKTAVGKPADWKAELEKYAAKTMKMEENVAGGNRISTRNGVLSYHGSELKEIHCVILTALVENAYYEGTYDPGAPRAPVCFAFSEDGEDMEPHENSHAKQNDTCDGCEKNEWGSADRGRGKACKNIRRVALLSISDNPTPEEINDAEIATISIPVTSVAAYSGHVKQIALNGMPPFAYHTRIWLENDPKTQYKVKFEMVGTRPLADKLLQAILSRVKAAEKILDQPYVYVAPETIERVAPRSGGKQKFARR